MITGTLMFDVEIACESEKALGELTSKIVKLVKGCDNQVVSCEEVDNNVVDDSEDASE